MKTNHLAVILMLLATILTFSACQKSFEETYGGVWEVVFTGNLPGSKIFTVNDNGSFSFDVIVSQGIFGTEINTIAGNVDDDGKVTADIYMDGDDIGDASGAFNSNGTGSGMYFTNLNTQGTWVATKQ